MTSVTSVPFGGWLSSAVFALLLSPAPPQKEKPSNRSREFLLGVSLETSLLRRKQSIIMRLLLCAMSVLCLVAIISAKKQIEENLDPIEPETKEHSSKKYSKEHQKSHHHGHKHKKHSIAEELPKEAEIKPKDTPVEIPEPEVKLQSDIETSKKAIKEEKRKAETEDLHLQDLTYEESLKKDKKKKKSHHGAHHAEVLEKPKGKGDHKLFTEEEAKSPKEKVIEDSFEPLKETRAEKKGKDKKSKDKSKGKKKASEKSKDKGKKSKEGKKGKDKSKKSKEGKGKW